MIFIFIYSPGLLGVNIVTMVTSSHGRAAVNRGTACQAWPNGRVGAGAETAKPCYSRAMDITHSLSFNEVDQRYITRAAAHAAAPLILRPEQRFNPAINDLHVARVFLAIERGALIVRSRTGQWLVQRDGNLPAMALTGIGSLLSRVSSEMVRTGLAKDYRRILVPADTHLRSFDRTLSVCRFTGEVMGPMRARLVDDVHLTDCPRCRLIHNYRNPLS